VILYMSSFFPNPVVNKAPIVIVAMNRRMSTLFMIYQNVSQMERSLSG